MSNAEKIRKYFQALLDVGYTRQNALDKTLWFKFSNLPADEVRAALGLK